MDKNKNSFFSDVKSGRIKQPTQIGFSENGWEKAFKSYDHISDHDQNLFSLGLWFNKYLYNIRNELKKYNDKVVNLSKLRQMYVSAINRDFYVADTAIKEHLENSKEKKNIMGTVHEKKLPIGPNDFNVHIFGAIESGLSALRFPLSETFREHDIVNKSVDDLEILHILSIRINLASTYSLISNLWGECLWNNWSIESKEKYDLIHPPKSNKHLCRVTSEHRFEALNAEFSYHTFNLWNQLPDEFKEIERKKARIISIQRKGKKKFLKLGTYVSEEMILPDLSMTIAAEEQYWNQLLVMPLPNYPNLTIRDLVKAWELFSSLGRALKSQLPSDTGVTRIAKLIQFAPKLKKTELIKTIKKATGFSHEKTLSIITLCTFSGDVKDDPWVKPLIPLDKEFFCFLVPSLIVTNRIRLIESWMREGGADLDKRGNAFEDYVRQEIKKCSKASKHMSNTFISPNSIRLSVADQEEEIDFVWIIGSLVLIGEIKCSLFPTSPIEFHNFFNLLDSASNQAKRKVDFVQKNINSLFHILQIDVPKNEDDLVIAPVVITNLPFGSGFPKNNVPITDLRILIRYMEGYQKFFVSKASDGSELSNKIVFFESEKEAQENILAFINLPPTIKFFIKHINSEVEPLWKFQNQKKEAGWLRFFVDESKVNLDQDS